MEQRWKDKYDREIRKRVVKRNVKGTKRNWNAKKTRMKLLKLVTQVVSLTLTVSHNQKSGIINL